MRFHKSNILLICSATALLTACDLYEPVPNYETVLKTPIELTIGDADGPMVSRALITNGTDKTLSPFANDAKIFMVMKSTYGTDDYQGSHEAKYTVTRGNVEKAVTTIVNEKTVNPVAFTTQNWRYWDDAHARSSQLNIWAYAQMGTGNTTEANTTTFDGQTFNTTEAPDPQWTSTAIEPTIAWKASTESDGAQNATTVLTQDLLFSNNLVDNSATGTNIGGENKTLKFNFSTRKFPQQGEAQMIFYHAMAKVTIRINEGDGFNTSSSDDFQFESGTNVKFTGFNTSGTFDIKQGVFTATAPGPIPSIYNKGFADGKYTLEALVVPGTDLYNSTVSDAFEFIIDDNKYTISAKTLAEAIRSWKDAEDNCPFSSFTNLEAGKNYIFTFTVGKTKIKNLTAQVVDWETVTAEEQFPSNARITLNVEDRTTNTSSVTSNMDIYRALDMADAIRDDYVGYNWKTGYTTDGKATWKNTTLAYNSAESRWSTDWFWESNKHYYHIRTLSPTSQVVTKDTDKGDYTTITSAPCNSEADYKQAAWGAPFANVDDINKFTYDPTGGLDGKFASSTKPYHQLYQAIGSTLDQIKVLMFHMYSGVHFTITTTTGNDKVELFDGTNRTRVDLVAYYPEGKVRLGTCLVDASGTVSTKAAPYNVSFASATDTGHYTNQEYFLSAVPQDLKDVKLHITTPDHNLYIVDLANVIVQNGNFSSTYIGTDYPSAGPDMYYINWWYPNVKYNYTITLKKNGITNLQATIVNWETLTADNETVQIQ